MTEPVAFPFRRPSPRCVTVGPWMVVRDDVAEPLGEVLEGWDYSVDVELRRHISIDPDLLLEDTGLDLGTKLRFNFYAATGELKIRRHIPGPRMEPVPGEPIMLDVGPITLEGGGMQGQLEIVSVLTVENSPRGNEMPLVPTSPGSRLWEDRHRCLLEGGAGRLPMESRDFGDLSPSWAYAPWYFNVENDQLEDRFEAVFRVVLNTARTEVISALKAGDPFATAMLRYDIVRHLAMRVLRNDAFTGHAEDYPEGSLGAVVSEWLAAAFPDRDTGQLPALLERSPEEFDVTVSSWAGSDNG